MNPIAMGFGIGIIVGIILFFILLATGMLDRLTEWMENRKQ